MKTNKKITTTLFYENGTMRISVTALELLGEPKYISLLINQNNHSIVCLPTLKEDKSAIKVKYRGTTLKNGKLICSCAFVRKIFTMEKWNPDIRYKINGIYSKTLNIISFNLFKAHSVSKGNHLK